MRLGSVRRLGRESAFQRTARMHRDAAVAMQDLHHGRGQSHGDRRARETIRDAVVVAFDGDVIVDVDLRRAPLTELIARDRQRAQRRAFGGSKTLRRLPASF